MQEMQCNGNFKQWCNVFLVISEAWQGYESKAYGVSKHHLKLQSKKFSRTRGIPNFPTQGWADTPFYTSNWNDTYMNLLDYSRHDKWNTPKPYFVVPTGVSVIEHKHNMKRFWNEFDKFCNGNYLKDQRCSIVCTTQHTTWIFHL